MTRLAGVLGVVILATSTVSAQSARDTIRGRVKDGQKVSITDSQGNETTGRIRTLAADGVQMLEHGKITAVPYDQIIRIDRPHDGLANGALIGLGAGALLSTVAIAAEDQRECVPGDPFCGEPAAGGYVAGALILGGLGAAVGVGIDALIRRDREIYRRGGQARVTISPSLSSRGRGALVSVSW